MGDPTLTAAATAGRRTALSGLAPPRTPGNPAMEPLALHWYTNERAAPPGSPVPVLPTALFGPPVWAPYSSALFLNSPLLPAIALLPPPTSHRLQASSSGSSLSVMVYDMGGGTLDVSLLNLNNGIFDVRSATPAQTPQAPARVPALKTPPSKRRPTP